MVKYIVTTFSLLISLTSFAQEANTVIDAENFSEEQLRNISNIAPHEGWVLLKYNGENYVSNYSNKDYLLYFSVNCKESTQEPQFLIEFSDNYRDGDFGGIDFASSKDDYREVEFLLDGEKIQNPFKNFEEVEFKSFIEALKKASVLTINVYDSNNEELELNRSLDFKLENGELLDYPVNCE